MSDLLFELFLLIVLENRNATLLAISHVIKSTILIGRNYLFNYIVQSNYYIFEIFNRCLFEKKNIEKKKVVSLLKS